MIFYFTATGNSKFIAERIATGTNDSMIDIAECVKADKYSFAIKDSETLGVVLPVYFYGIPIIVAEFLENLNIPLKADTFVYAVLNCGGTTANAEKFINQRMSVNAIFGIKTVDNYVPMYKIISGENINVRLDKAEHDIDEVIRHIKERRNGGVNNFKGVFPRLSTSILYLVYKYGRKTKEFTVNENCIGCGLCEKICPRQIIKLNKGTPVWEEERCEICFACLHRCPESAINYGKNTAKNGRYLNNRVKL
ncbi:MAG: EFR1 family ferrodoxin [Syntrophomonadaceae bacterium]|jgi:ferredoxin|nr:EFR1 family ferrodoxin [Syntrophomonadaceae bacterium]